MSWAARVAQRLAVYLLVGNWAVWATQIVTDWPDDPRQASHDPSVIAETNLRAATRAERRS